jgi:hypothetical protein
MATNAKKIHAFGPDPERGMPIDISKEFYAQGLRGSLCGYMRRVTFDNAQVTCFYCLRKLESRQRH